MLQKRSIYIVPEPKVLEFTDKWFPFDGFSNFPEFLSREFNIPKGSWEVIKVSGEGNAGVEIEKGAVKIWGDEKIAYATIIQLLIQNGMYLPEIRIIEEFQFNFRGFHLDVARGGVPTIATLKKILRWLFILKYNYFALYLEDLFPWKGYPDIGFSRGRYSEDELREVIEYGVKLGIDVFPSLELCGHMENILTLPQFHKFSEWHNPREGVLNVSDEEARVFAYSLLEEVLDFFPSKYVHIGGDETWALGRGRSLDKTEKFIGPELYEVHHYNMIKIAKSRNKIPMIWGDMIAAAYLREGERELWKKIMDSQIWKEVIVVNWDYSPSPREYFKEKIKLFKERGFNQIVAPGLWNWNRYYPDFPTALENLKNFLGAAKDEGISGFLVTAWGDDGSECLFSFLDPLILAAMEYAEGSGSWEDKWAALTGEEPRVVGARKLYGEVDTVITKWKVRWGIWLPKHILLKTEISKLIPRFVNTNEIASLRNAIERTLEGVKDVKLPEDLNFIRDFLKAVLKSIDGCLTVSDYIALAKEYSDLWLKERKIDGLENIVGRFWRAAGVCDLLL
ncbi:MAG: beta-N-acetylhexosaminidase [Ignisphaera sp.]|nr:beta-N-acetylhexosaminidase [Ignisphaera sp.]MCX8167837.1 beta-N-acetylhexosaminidase [Ignisphaera sp.]MDW8085798.1 beta-N-acetylhexosaminidase [Ignisphaera sp.]